MKEECLGARIVSSVIVSHSALSAHSQHVAISVVNHAVKVNAPHCAAVLKVEQQ
jgi:hypothetical protein